MSRRNRHHQQRRFNIAWPIIILGALLIAGAAFWISRPGAAPSDQAGASPQISVDQQKIDYGYVKFGGNRSFKIAVTNTGSGPLRFKAKPYVQVLEGC